MKRPFFTIGHSNRSLDEFISLIREVDIALVVDIRTIPRSKSNPQFNEDTLPNALADFDISYERAAALGGLRGKQRDVPPDVNGFWTNQSFHNYADYALSSQFQNALQNLRHEGHDRPCTIMCSEAVWWRCHRRIVADYLIANGETVFHIMGHDRLESAHLTAAAVVEPKGIILYPATDGAEQ